MLEKIEYPLLGSGKVLLAGARAKVGEKGSKIRVLEMGLFDQGPK